MIESGVFNQIKQIILEFHCFDDQNPYFLKMINSIIKLEESGFVKIIIVKSGGSKDQDFGEVPFVTMMLLLNKKYFVDN